MTDEELRVRFACAALAGAMTNASRECALVDIADDTCSVAAATLAEYRRRWPEEGGKDE